MKKMKCECCGGTINTATYKCEYCGTQYEGLSQDCIRIVSHTPGCRVLSSNMAIDGMMLHEFGEKEAAEMAIDRLARNIAESLVPYMDIETEYDPCFRQQIIKARVRVIEPDYRF